MNQPVRTRAYWVVSKGRGELRPADLPAKPAAGHSRIATDFTGVSPGTERLVGLGRVPQACRESMACAYMEGDFDLPVKYGYTLVGTCVNGVHEGRRVFLMHPHQSLVDVDEGQLTLLPEDVPSHRAVLLPNLETALNAVWDAELAPGEEALVVGAGSVGLLVAFVLQRLRGCAPVLVEVDEERRRLAGGLPWVSGVCAPDACEPGAAQVCFHTSGSPLGLETSLATIGFEGRVIELSWFGDRPVQLDLGGRFFTQRQRIIASQVAHVANSHRATHAKAQRRQAVLELLSVDDLELLLDDPLPFEELPDLMHDLYRGRARGLLPLISHRQNQGDACTPSP